MFHDSYFSTRLRQNRRDAAQSVPLQHGKKIPTHWAGKLMAGVAKLVLLLSIGCFGTFAQADGNSQNLEIIGQTGGVTKAIFVQGNYAYIGEGMRLVILDVSDPDHPQQIGKSPILSDVVRDIFVIGNYAYVASGKGGFSIINVSDHSNPTVESNLTFLPSRALHVTNGYAYVVNDDNSLQIVNVTNPKQPTLVNTITTPGLTKDIHIVGNYAYVVLSNFNGDIYPYAITSGSLLIFDVTNSSNPALVKNLDMPGGIWCVSVYNGYAYMATYQPGYLVIANVSDPANSYIVKKSVASDPFLAIHTVNNRLYGVNGIGLEVMDISNPESPISKGWYKTATGGTGSGRGPRGIYVSNNYAYVADSYGGLQIVNTSEPSNLVLVGHHKTPSSSHEISVVDNLIYGLVGNGVGELTVIDGSNPYSLMTVGNSTIFNNNGISGWGHIYTTNNYSVLTYGTNTDMEGYNGMQVIDVSNPNSPTARGTLNIKGWGQGVYVNGYYAYLAAYHGGLQIVDISNPDMPVLVGNVDMPDDRFIDVSVVGNYAYVAASSGLRVIDVSNPTSPVLVGSSLSSSTVGGYGGIYVTKDYAYATGRGLDVIDIRVPEKPTLITSFDTGNYVNGIKVSEGYAYVALGNIFSVVNGLKIIDINNPTSLSLAGYFPIPSGVQDISVANGYIYAASADVGLLVLRLSPKFELTAKSPTSICAGSTFDVTIRADKIDTQPAVDGVEVSLKFDPSQLQVNSVTNSGVLDFELDNNVDSIGTINFSAIALDNPVQTTSFDVFTINFTAIGNAKTTVLDLLDNSKLTNSGATVLASVVDNTLTFSQCLGYQVTLQQKNSKGSWANTDLAISLGTTDIAKSYPSTADASGEGTLTLEDAPTNDDHFCVKNSHTLANRIVPPYPKVGNRIDFGTLWEGDAVEDNKLKTNDASFIASKAKCYTACLPTLPASCSAKDFQQADLNVDGCVNVNDVNLFKSNFTTPNLKTSDCVWMSNLGQYRKGQRRDGDRQPLSLGNRSVLELLQFPKT